MTPRSRLVEVAKKSLGHEDFAARTEEAVTSLLDGRDTLVVMPTGSKKLAIYQIAAEMIEGPRLWTPH
ncbi:MAG: hypothetical protein M3198_16065 [Actinomycetota bacterium]|nr:hypothetical protein [Actinomycetota bacterium]